MLWAWRDRAKWEVETARQRKEIMLMIYQELTQCMRMVVGQAKVLEKGLDKVRPIDAMTLREVRLHLSFSLFFSPPPTRFVSLRQ